MGLKSFSDLTKAQQNEVERRFAFAKASDDSRGRKATGAGRAGPRGVEARQLSKLIDAIDGCGQSARDLIALNDPSPWQHIDDLGSGPSGRSLLDQMRILVQTAIECTDAERGRPPRSRYQEVALMLAGYWAKSGEDVVIGSHPNAARVKGTSPVVNFIGRCFLELEPELKTLSAAQTRARSALLALRKSGQLQNLSRNTSASRRRL